MSLISVLGFAVSAALCGGVGDVAVRQSRAGRVVFYLPCEKRVTVSPVPASLVVPVGRVDSVFGFLSRLIYDLYDDAGYIEYEDLELWYSFSTLGYSVAVAFDGENMAVAVAREGRLVNVTALAIYERPQSLTQDEAAELVARAASGEEYSDVPGVGYVELGPDLLGSYGAPVSHSKVIVAWTSDLAWVDAYAEALRVRGRCTTNRGVTICGQAQPWGRVLARYVPRRSRMDILALVYVS